MANRVSIYRVSSATMANLVGEVAELIVDVTNWILTLHDGVTPGGIPLARQDLSNVLVASASNDGKMSSEQAVALATAVTNISALQSALSAPSGTRMVFHQTTAPTGWTKDTTINDKALRIVSGSVSSGGATAFSSVFGSGKTTGSHTLTTAQIPAHSHSASTGSNGSHNHNGATASGGAHTHTGTTDAGGSHFHYAARSGVVTNDVLTANAPIAEETTAGGDTEYDLGSGTGEANLGRTSTASAHTHGFTTGSASAHTHTIAIDGAHTHTVSVSNTGGGEGHTHTLSLDLAYVDVIIAVKD